MAQLQGAQPSHSGHCILTGSESPLQSALDVSKSQYSVAFQLQLKIQTEQDRSKGSHLSLLTAADARSQ